MNLVNNLHIHINFKEYIDGIISRARLTLGIIIRSGKEFTVHTLTTLFKTLVRPILECNSVIWAPSFDLISTGWRKCNASYQDKSIDDVYEPHGIYQKPYRS